MKCKVEHMEEFKLKALEWSLQQKTCMFVNGNQISTLHDGFPEMLAIGIKSEITGKTRDDLQLLNEAVGNGNYYFGYFSYDLKNWLEKLGSNKVDYLGFPMFYFFQPKHIIRFEADEIEILSEAANAVFNQISETPISSRGVNVHPGFSSVLPKEEYIQNVQKIRQHILDGDIYELNYCMSFKATVPNFNSPHLYTKINSDSPAPFSSYFESPSHSIISASPERFIRKSSRTIFSQPMKGTIRRGKTPEEDHLLRQQLRSSEKEQAENLMIVDLVRNDLARSAETGSVKVEELFGIYSFRYVHQMISTITAIQSSNVSDLDVILNAFPMGSMTGAPKIKAMELIDRYENSSRGAFSGAAGYFDPDGNFDFNVLIRSVFYNKKNQNLIISAGSAITYDSDPEKEYEECLLKAENLFKAFEND